MALVLYRPTLDDKLGLEVFFGEQGTKPQTGGGYTLEILAGVLAVLGLGAGRSVAMRTIASAPTGGGFTHAPARARRRRSPDDEASSPDPAA